jgi:isopenicillin N synthase-like dioxygenase
MPGDYWIDVPAEENIFIINIGDMLDRLTEGRYRSTPHRVLNISGRQRISLPFFVDPSWEAEVVPLPLDGTPPADDLTRRWDASSVHAWSGPYGKYLTAKVSKVFPDLFANLKN